MTAMEQIREEYGQEHFTQVFRTITVDNGSEFAELPRLEAYGAKTCYAHPYSSWERGQNERHNRIVRLSIPKETPLNNYTDEDFRQTEQTINSCPRKSLGYQTPKELFDAFPDTVYALPPQKHS